jgi:hypothetical protein
MSPNKICETIGEHRGMSLVVVVVKCSGTCWIIVIMMESSNTYAAEIKSKADIFHSEFKISSKTVQVNFEKFET